MPYRVEGQRLGVLIQLSGGFFVRNGAIKESDRVALEAAGFTLLECLGIPAPKPTLQELEEIARADRLRVSMRRSAASTMRDALKQLRKTTHDPNKVD
jgi:hypothetical protein